MVDFCMIPCCESEGFSTILEVMMVELRYRTCLGRVMQKYKTGMAFSRRPLDKVVH